MPDLNLNDLRSLLDEHESYVNSIKAGDPAAGIAKEMLAVIDEARALLRPSADSTANYVDARRIIERLGTLRKQAAEAA